MFGFFKRKPTQNEMIRRYEISTPKNMRLAATKMSTLINDVFVERSIEFDPRVIDLECMVFLYWITSRTLDKKYNFSRSEIGTIMRETSIDILVRFSILQHFECGMVLKENPKDMITDDIMVQFNKDMDSAFTEYPVALHYTQEYADKTNILPITRVFIARLARHDPSLPGRIPYTIYIMLDALLLDALVWPTEMFKLAGK